MTIKIIKQNFSIPTARVPAVLNELKTLYPKIITNNEISAVNLQTLIFNLGFHTRINASGSLFTINKSPRVKTQNVDPKNILEVLVKYMPDDGYVTAVIDEEEITYTNKSVECNEGTLAVDEIVEEISSIELDESDEESLVDNVINITEDEEIKSESVIYSNVVKKKRGGRPRKVT